MLNGHALASVFTSFHIGEPCDSGGWRLFPLFPKSPPSERFATAFGATRRGLARVEELPGGPDVRSLLLTNEGEIPLLVTDGTLFYAGLQDRIADRPLIVRAKSRAPIPVSCVESARWEPRDRPDLGVCPLQSDLVVRRARMDAGALGARPDQKLTWASVARRRSARGLSEGGSLVEAQVLDAALLEDAVAELVPVHGATGLAMCRDTPRGPRVALVEWFADPAACAESWEPLVRGALTSAPPAKRPPRISRTELRSLFRALAAAPLTSLPDESLGALVACGLGRTRLRALSMGERPLHLVALHG